MLEFRIRRNIEKKKGRKNYGRGKGWTWFAEIPDKLESTQFLRESNY